MAVSGNGPIRIYLFDKENSILFIPENAMSTFGRERFQYIASLLLY